MCYKNFIRIKTILPWRRRFLILDRREHFSDRIFTDGTVPVSFGSREYLDAGTGYCFVSCRIGRKDEERFLSCLEELKDTMLLAGHTDYEDFCRKGFTSV